MADILHKSIHELKQEQAYKDAAMALQKKYYHDTIDKLKEEFSFKNKLQCPRIKYIVLSKGLNTIPGKAVNQEQAMINLGLIACQKPIAIKAKRSVSQFKISEGRVNGCKVTLRRDNMYFFLEKLIEYYFTVERKFAGIKKKSFNKQKKNISISLGIDDERLFPEITGNNASLREGFNVTIVTNGTEVDHIAFLLNTIGIPIIG